MNKFLFLKISGFHTCIAYYCQNLHLLIVPKLRFITVPLERKYLVGIKKTTQKNIPILLKRYQDV